MFEQGKIDEGLKPYIDLAVADLAGHLGVDPGAVTTLSAVVVGLARRQSSLPRAGSILAVLKRQFLLQRAAFRNC